MFITIYDPVAGQMIQLNPRQKTAIVNAFPFMPARTNEHVSGWSS